MADATAFFFTHTIMRLILFVLFYLIGSQLFAQTNYKSNIESIISNLYRKPSVAYEEANFVYSEAQGYYKAKALALMGRIDQRKKNSVSAYMHYSEALDILYQSDTLDHYLEQVCFNNLAIISEDAGRFETAAKEYQKAAQAAERYIKEYPNVAAKYNEQFLDTKMKFYEANALYDAGLIEKAREVYESIDEGLTNSKLEVEDINTYALVRNEYGLNEKAIGNYDNAIYYFNTVTENPAVPLNYKGSAEHNKALCYWKMDSVELALRCFNKAINYSQRGSKWNLFISHMDKGELLLKQKRYNEAIDSFYDALATGQDVKYDMRLVNVYYLLEKAYKRVDLDKSDNYGQEYTELKSEALAHQDKLIDAEKKRVFALGISSKYHMKKIQEYERSNLMDKLGMYVLIILLITSIARFALSLIRRKRAAVDTAV